MSFWVIERFAWSSIHYWNAGGRGEAMHPDKTCGAWVRSIDDAVHFVRQEDADTVLYRLLEECGRAVEHTYIAGRSVPGPILHRLAERISDGGAPC